MSQEGWYHTVPTFRTPCTTWHPHPCLVGLYLRSLLAQRRVSANAVACLPIAWILTEDGLSQDAWLRGFSPSSEASLA
jgi:hypothetical protein